MAEHMQPPPTAATEYRYSSHKKKQIWVWVGPKVGRLPPTVESSSCTVKDFLWEPGCKWGREGGTQQSCRQSMHPVVRTQPYWLGGEVAKQWLQRETDWSQTMEPCCWVRASFCRPWKPFHILWGKDPSKYRTVHRNMWITTKALNKYESNLNFSSSHILSQNT